MPNFFEYHRSVADEFKAYENRVRYLIDDRHWGEDGRYKEIILINYLKRVLPKNISVGTGFVRNQNQITNQIDIIIYDNSFPLLLSEGDFIIATAENVLGIIEVKTDIEPSRLCEYIDKANENAKIIAGYRDMRYLYNGIFSFNSRNLSDKYIEHLESHSFEELLKRQHFNQIISPDLYHCVNHIALGNQFFIKLWPTGHNSNFDNSYYSIYNMNEGLAVTYFISNLIEFCVYHTGSYLRQEIPDELYSFLYPYPRGKEERLIKEIYLNHSST